jgi:hypothetical protein
MVWNICESVYDRNKVDDTWTPILRTEKELHWDWLKETENESKFKRNFRDYINNTDFNPDISKSVTTRIGCYLYRNAKSAIFIGLEGITG